MSSVFFFNDTATTEIYTLSLHDALPISSPWAATSATPAASSASSFTRTTTGWQGRSSTCAQGSNGDRCRSAASSPDRKSTRLNSSHSQISYAVFCLKKKKNKDITHETDT